jgi:hypothetical protein
VIQQLADVGVVLYVQLGSEFAVGHGHEDSFGRRLPHGGSSFEFCFTEPSQQIDDRGPSGRHSIENAEIRIEMVKSGNEQADHALAAEIRRCDHVDDELHPGLGFAPLRWNERIETKRRDVAADRENLQIGADLAQVAISAFPVQGHDFDAACHDPLKKHKRQVGLARAAASGNEDVLFEAPAAELEGEESSVRVGHGAHRDVS